MILKAGEDDWFTSEPLPAAAVRAHRIACRSGVVHWGERAVPEEVAIALTYDGSTHAVMMATPSDIDDFALGFSLNEGIVSEATEIIGMEILRLANGIDARMWLARSSSRRQAKRRRLIVGPTGCGLCGIESLAEAVKSVPTVTSSLRVTSTDIAEALFQLTHGQLLHADTRAVHGAAFWSLAEGAVVLREDIGRHNALDKLAGALARQPRDVSKGLLVVTSRLSVEMVQKAACIGAPILVAVSAPTALALRVAEASGITLVALARGDDFEVFTHPHRISGPDLLPLVALGPNYRSRHRPHIRAAEEKPASADPR